MKLTERQTEKFYAFVLEYARKGNCNDTWFNAPDRLANKLEKMGLIEYILDDYKGDFGGIQFVGDDNYYNVILTDRGQAIFGDITPEARELARLANACPKCNGHGRIREYSHVQGGICFGCNGTGRK